MIAVGEEIKDAVKEVSKEKTKEANADAILSGDATYLSGVVERLRSKVADLPKR